MRARRLADSPGVLRRRCVLVALLAAAPPVTTGQPQAPELVVQNRSPGMHVSFSPDGRLIATGGEYSEAVRLWEVSTGRLVRELPASRLGYADVVFSLDGRLVAAVPMSLKHAMNGGRWAGKVTVWSVSDGQRLAGELPWSPSEISAWAFAATDSAAHRVATQTDSVRVISADGRVGVALDGDRARRIVTVRSLPSGAETARLPGTFTDVWLMALSPDAHFLALRWQRKGVEIWNLDRRERVATLEDSASTHSLAFAPDGLHLAIGAERTVRLYDTRDWRSTTSIAVDAELSIGIRELVFSRDSRRLAISGDDLRIIDLASGAMFPKPGSRIASIDAWAHVDSALAVARSVKPRTRYADTTATVELWPFGGASPRQIGSGLYDVVSLAMSTDARRVVAGSMAATIWSRYTAAYEGGHWIWDGTTGVARTSTDRDPRRPVSEVVLAPNGGSAVAVTHDPIPTTRTCPYVECGEDEWTDYTVYLTRIDLRTGGETDVARLGRSDGHAGRVALSPRGDRALARQDDVFRVTDAITGKRLTTFRIPGASTASNRFYGCDELEEPPPAERFSPNSRSVLVANAAGVIVVSATSGRVIRRHSVDNGESPRVLVRSHFMGDSAVALLTCADGTPGRRLERLDIRTGTVHEIARLPDPVEDVAFLPGGRFVTHADGVMRVHAPTGALLAWLLFGVDGEWLVVTPAGLYDGSSRGVALAAWRTGTTLVSVDQLPGARQVSGLLSVVSR